MVMRNQALALMLLSALIICLVPPGAQAASPAGPSEFVLKNGMKVLILEDHKSPLAIFQVWYKVGSVDEPSGRQGMSHLLEHMMFKGTKKYGQKEISRLVQSNGGVLNAFTSYDMTVYWELMPSDRIGLAMEIEADRMRNLVMDEAMTASERSVVMEERRMRTEDDPQSAMYESLLAASFDVHPYGQPIIGWMESLAATGRDELYEHYRRFYSPDNAVAILVGDVDTQSALKLIKKRFGSIPAYKGKRDSFIVAEPPHAAPRRITLVREAELPFVALLWHTPNFPSKDAYALEALAHILSAGRSSRLYRSMIYDSRLAINVDADFSGLMRYPFVFTLDATAAPGVGPEAVEEALLSELEKLSADGPSPEELQRALNGIEAGYIMGQDSIMTTATLLGSSEIQAGDWRFIDRYLDGIRGVTAEDVMRVGRAYLGRDKMDAAWLVPKEKKQ